jgi:hypothetical protein
MEVKPQEAFQVGDSFPRRPRLNDLQDGRKSYGGSELA